MEELEARFLLNASDVFNAEQQNRILSHFDSAVRFMQDAQAAAIWVGQDSWVAFNKKCDRLMHDQTLSRLHDQGVCLMLSGDENYPPHFYHLSCPPQLLYLKGELPENPFFGISIVGTRRPTLYGRQMAQRFAQELAAEGITIISGLAKGIDGVALKATLDVHGKAIAFLGTGIDRVYPRENEELFKRMNQSGLLISEYPPGAAPIKHHFPWRNRLISAWGLGVLVVEAGLPSGTMVTVRWALEQGKDCFAIPGPINSDVSKGPHQMIRDGATLVERVDDILECYQTMMTSFKQYDSAEISSKIEPHENELGLSYEPRSIEELLMKSGKDYEELNQALNHAVLTGQVQRFPGQQYALIRHNEIS